LAASLIASTALANSSDHQLRSRNPHCLGHRATIVGPNDPADTPPGTGDGPRPAIIGTPHADVIVGTRASEWIVGNGGADVVCAGAGRDVVFIGWGDHGADKRGHVDAGRGADYVEGGVRRDKLDLGDGDDVADGEFGRDIIKGGPGDDFIRAQVGNDRIFGEQGADHVEASSGNDFVDGGAGDDKMSTGDGSDRAEGGAGDDLIHLLGGDDHGYGGIGDDFVGGFDGRDVLQGGPNTDICSGGYDYDRFFGCERRKERTGPKPPPTPHVKLPPYSGTRPVKDLLAFRSFLRRQTTVSTNHRMGWLIARFHQLARAANDAVDVHWRRMLDEGVRPMTATLRRSIDYHRVRQVETGISDEIDRLRIVFRNEQRRG
jgi:hypothetical protein